MSANSDSQASSSSPGPPSAIQRVTRRLARSTLTLSKVEGVQNEDGDETGMSTARATMDSDDDSASSGVTTRPPKSSLGHSDHEEHADSEQSTSLDSEQLHSQYSGSTGSHDSGLSPSTCQLCFDTPDTLIALMCGHTCCKQCLNRLFKTGTANPRSFPPKCCEEPIELTAVQVYLDDDVFRRYNDVYSEFSDKNRLYCANKRCGSYIRQSHTIQNGRSIMCGGCGTYTCVDCKQVRDEHVIQDGVLQCKQPEQLMSTADRKLANARGWKQCPGCKNLIEKSEGCDHECRCEVEMEGLDLDDVYNPPLTTAPGGLQRLILDYMQQERASTAPAPLDNPLRERVPGIQPIPGLDMDDGANQTFAPRLQPPAVYPSANSQSVGSSMNASSWEEQFFSWQGLDPFRFEDPPGQQLPPGHNQHPANPSGERTVDSSTAPPRPNFIESMLEESSGRAENNTTGEGTSMTRENVKPGTKRQRSEEDE
ncbi:hypothetical protein LTR13_010111 [Exophiala sideris]|uniref:RING-type domain-containing protein n=1 Tax=Exophiala sideris TaxID=1016849 RepID=A0ABR0IXR9_9EURO|nr:hypothetical protein LTR13_010111 [Exophiala sideris]KAK5051119.1 hypothetical protein LTR69_010496 [Exophiala sideris]